MKNLLATVLLGAALLQTPVLAAPDMEAVLSNLESYAEKSRREWGTPGMAIAVVVGDQIVYSKAFGVLEAGSQQPVTPETVFQIGSISKSFTSALVGTLVDEGKVAWTDRVVDIVPAFRMYDPWVTREFMVQDTMSQRSGMAAYAGDILAFLGRDRQQMVEAIRHIKPVSSVRSEFAYVNNLWLVAAEIIETKTGKSWEQNIEERLFGPLKMSSSSTGLAEFYDAPNHATPHARGPGGPVPLQRDWPFAGWVYSYGPAGGVNSNVLDMARYARAQLHGSVDGEEILSRRALDVLHAPHIFMGGESKTPSSGLLDAGPASYCLGWIRQQRTPQPLIWHNGGTSGSKTVLGMIPDSDAATVVLTNFADAELPEAIMYRFYDLLLERPEQDYSAQFLVSHMARMPVAPERPKPAAAPMPLESYAGTYHHPVYGDVVVRREGQALLARMTQSSHLEMRLAPWYRDTFVFSQPLDPSAPPEFATFGMDESGRVTSLKLDFLFESPGGLFMRTDQP